MIESVGYCPDKCRFTPVTSPAIPSPKGAAISGLLRIPGQVYPYDARGIRKRFRHAAIFGALDALRHGETMRFR